MGAGGFDPAALAHLDAVAAAPTLTAPIAVDALEPGWGPGTIWAKLEYQLPSGSTKDRIAAHILRRAIADGRVTPATTVIEASSGSTSISFAMLCARLGLRFVAVMPEGVSSERLLIIRRYGGDYELTPAAGGVPGSIAHAEARSTEPDVFWPDQFRNPANAEVHEQVTGPQLIAEVAARTGAPPDGFVAAVGTAGTLMGIGRALHAVAPGAGVFRAVFTGEPADAEQGGVPCGIPGVVDCLSGLLDRADVGLVGEIVIDRARALEYTRRLCALGFAVGPSSGLNVAAAVPVARRLGPGAQVATVFCDRMERYFSTDLFDDLAPT